MGEAEQNRVGEPLSKDPLYVQVERRIEDLLVKNHYRLGERIPPEAELVKSLGVSRVTVRSGLARLVERGILERRRGSGTFLARAPVGDGLRSGPLGLKLGSRETGLGKLETYTVMARRLGLELSSKNLRVRTSGAGPEEAEVLEVPEGSRLVEVSRVVLADGEPMAWMVDLVPEDVIDANVVRKNFRPDAMLLDVLASERVPVGFSELLIDAAIAGPDDATGKALGLEEPSAVLSVTETMYQETDNPHDARPVQWSRNVFLPGKLNLHVVREPQ